jgi:hypothetical protein
VLIELALLHWCLITGATRSHRHCKCKWKYRNGSMSSLRLPFLLIFLNLNVHLLAGCCFIPHPLYSICFSTVIHSYLGKKIQKLCTSAVTEDLLVAGICSYKNGRFGQHTFQIAVLNRLLLLDHLGSLMCV